MNAIFETNLKGLPKPRRGKVRDIYDLGNELLIVASDRISCFDAVLPTPIPGKGALLNKLSRFWFDKIGKIVPNHLSSRSLAEVIPDATEREALGERAMLAKKAQPLPIEAIVRGYISGSGWKDYKKTGTIAGLKLPAGLRESDQFVEPLFTPSTKATSGHDENINFEEMKKLLGKELAEKVRDVSLKVYSTCAALARERGVIIADTKFEFGLLDGELIIIDEVLTPDSSRFWPLNEYQPGKGQPSFDKQFVRDYLESLNWNKEPPAPNLPQDIIEKTLAKYQEAYKKITGHS